VWSVGDGGRKIRGRCMSLNRQKGNMYEWVTHTWNPIGGRCPHQCAYCYMLGLPVGELRLRPKFLRDDNLSGKTIFVGSSTDMWAEDVPDEWIERVLYCCNQFPESTFLFQSKNPLRFVHFLGFGFPPKTVLGTTIESNRDYDISEAPTIWHRVNPMIAIEGHRKMVSIEPVLDFDPEQLVEYIKRIGPEFVSIGADSKGHRLPEPSAEKVRSLIDELDVFTEVKLKSNLARLGIDLDEFEKQAVDFDSVA